MRRLIVILLCCLSVHAGIIPLGRHLPTEEPMLGAFLRGDNSISKGLVGGWILNEESGLVVYDASGNQNTVTLTSMEGNDWTPVTNGTGLNFDGVAEYGLVNDSPELRITTELTIMTMIKFSSVTGSFLSKWGDANARRDFWFLSSANTIDFRLNDGVDLYRWITDNTWSADVWYNIAVAWNGTAGTVNIWVNGIDQPLTQTHEATVLGAIRGLSQRVIIAAGDEYTDPPVWFFPGDMAYIMLWDRALVDFEIRTLCSDPFQMFRHKPIMFTVPAAAPSSQMIMINM